MIDEELLERITVDARVMVGKPVHESSLILNLDEVITKE